MKQTGVLLCELILLACVSSVNGQTTPASKLFRSDVLVNDLRVISADDMGGREPDTPGHDKALKFLLQRYAEIGLGKFGGTYEQKYEFVFPGRTKEQHHGVNVVGFVRGSEHPDRYIVFSAHYDHLGVQNGKVYNGADDNGTGVAALLTLAQYFQKNKPKNSLIFVMMDSEEASGAGSRRFVEDAPVPLREIALNLNVDMIGRDPKNILYAVGTYHYPFLKPYLQDVAKRAPVDLRFGYDVPYIKGTEDWSADSDHLSFHLSKIPFIYFGVEDFDQHHQPTDDFETIMLPFYVHAVETIVDATKAFDTNLDAITAATPSRFQPGWPVLNDAVEKKVLATHTMFENAVKSHDADMLNSILARDLNLATADGKVVSRDVEVARLTDAKTQFRTFETENIRVRVYGRAAIVTGRFKEQGESDGKPFSSNPLFTATYVLRGVNWEIVTMQLSEPTNSTK